MPTMRR